MPEIEFQPLNFYQAAQIEVPDLFGSISRFIDQQLDWLWLQVQVWVVNPLRDLWTHVSNTAFNILGAIVQSIGDNASWIVRTIGGGFAAIDFPDLTEIGGAVGAAIANLWALISNPTSGVLGWIESNTSWIGDRLRDGWDGLITAGVQGAADILGSVAGAVIDLVASVGENASWVWENVAPAISDVVNTIHASDEWTEGRLGYYDDLEHGRYGLLTMSLFGAELNRMPPSFPGAPTQPDNGEGWLPGLWTHVTGVGEFVAEFIGRELVDPLGDWLARLADWFQARWDETSTFIRDLYQGELGRVLVALANPTIAASLAAEATVFPWARGMLDEASAALIGIPSSRAAAGPASAPEAIQAMIGTFGPIALALASAQILPSLIHPLHSLHMDALGRAVEQVSDFQEANSRWIRPMYDAFVGIPSSYYFNSLFTPRLPGPSELVGLLGEHEISYQTYVDTIAFHGINAEWAEHLAALADRPVQVRLVGQMGELGFVTPEWRESEIKNASYNEEAVPVLLAAQDVQVLQAGAGRGVSSLLGLYRDGFMSADQLSAELASIGYSDRYIEGVIRAGDWQYNADYVADQLSALRAGYAKDEIDEGEFRGQLVELGLVAQRIESIVQVENTKKVPAPKRVRPEDAKPAYQRPAGERLVDAAVLRYEHDLLDVNELQAALADAEMPEDLAAATIDLANARKQVADLPPRPAARGPWETDAGRLQVRTLSLLYLKRQIDEADLRAGLAGLEMPDALAQAHVENAIADRLRPPGPREFPIPELVPGSPESILFTNARTAYRSGRIGEDQLGEALIQLGYRPDDARAVIDAEALIREVRPAPRAPAIPVLEPGSPEALRFGNARAAFRRGTLAADELLSVLRSLGYDERDAPQIVEAEQLLLRTELVTPPPRIPRLEPGSPESILFGAIMSAYRERRATEAELSTALVQLGYRSADAAAIVQAEALFRREREPEPPGRIPQLVANSPSAILFTNIRQAFRQGLAPVAELVSTLTRLGYRAEDAQAIASADGVLLREGPAEPPPEFPVFEPRSPQAILFNNARSAFRQGLLTAEELLSTLQFLGYRPADAAAIVAADRLLIAPPEAPVTPRIPQLTAGSPEALLFVNARAAYRAARLDDADLLNILVVLGYSLADAQGVVDAESLVRREPPPPPEPV